MNMEQKNPIIVGLDIGTTKIVAIAGRKNEFGKIEILGYGKSNSSGVNHGMVLNIDECNKCIETALEDCYKRNPNLKINEVYVGVAGHHIKSLQNSGQRVIQSEDEVVTQRDVEMLIKEQRKTNIHPGDQIIDVIPQEFMVDSHGPFLREQIVGMSANTIRANFHIITADRMAIKNINRAVTRSELSVKDFELQPLASAAAVLSPEDIEMGVAIIDIGGGTTDLAVFHDGIIKHTAVIPRAGVNITQDIKNGLGVLKAQAEIMKIKFGVAMADEVSGNTFISIPGIRGHAPKEISVKNLANIIQARVEEILEHVLHQLRQLNLEDKLNGGVILTGGGSQLKNLRQLTEYKLGMPARIGFPNQHISGKLALELNQPSFATCLGLVLRGYDDVENKRFASFDANTVFEIESFENTTQENPIVVNETSTNDVLKSLFPEERKEEEIPLEKKSDEDIKKEMEDLFHTSGPELPPAETPPNIEQNENVDKAQKRGNNIITNIFGKLKNKIIDSFDAGTDDKLD